MITKVISPIRVVNELFKLRYEARDMSKEGWIRLYGSGTLQKSHNLELCCNILYLEERTAWEFGWEFRCVPTSRVTFNQLLAEGDCPAITEIVWHASRSPLALFPSDKWEVKYLHYTKSEDEKIEGAGIIIKETDADWVPKGHLIFAIVSEWDSIKKMWKEAKNPW